MTVWNQWNGMVEWNSGLKYWNLAFTVLRTRVSPWENVGTAAANQAFRVYTPKARCVCHILVLRPQFEFLL